MSRKFFLFFPLLFLSFSLAFGNDDPERFLKENKLEGSFFLKEIATGREYVVNPEDVDLPTLPASTFKIKTTSSASRQGGEEFRLFWTVIR